MSESERELARRALLGEDILDELAYQKKVQTLPPLLRSGDMPRSANTAKEIEPLSFEGSAPETSLPKKNPVSETFRATQPQKPEISTPVHQKPRYAAPESKTDNIKNHPSRVFSLETYENDAAHSIEESKKSLLKLQLAEQKATHKNRPIQSTASHPRAKTLTIVGIIVILIAGGSLGGLFWIRDMNQHQTSTITPGIIGADTVTFIPTNTINSHSLVQKVATLKKTDKLTELRVINSITQTPLSASEFMNNFVPGTPNELTRNLTGNPMFGVQNGNVFLLLKTNSYEHAYPAMLSWEQTMIQDIGPLFGIQNTAPFTDNVVANKNVRIATTVGDNGLVYGFIDNHTLLITSSKKLFSQLVSIYFAGKIVQ